MVSRRNQIRTLFMVGVTLLWAAGSAVAFPAGAQVQSSAPATTAVTGHELPTGTVMDVKLNDQLSSKTSKAGDPFRAEVTQSVRDAQGRVVIPPGSSVAGTVEQAKKAGTMGGQSLLQLRFTSLILPNGKSVPLTATLKGVESGGGVGGAITGSEKTTEEGGVERSKTRSTVGTTAAGGGVGAIIGGIAGGGKGAGIGTLIGAGVGAIAGSQGGEITLKKGTEMTIKLDKPLVVR